MRGLLSLPIPPRHGGYSALNPSPLGSPTARAKQQRQQRTKALLAGGIAALLLAAALAALAVAQHRSNREWQQHGCALKILDKTVYMGSVFEVGCAAARRRCHLRAQRDSGAALRSFAPDC